MPHIAVKLTLDQAQALLELVENQLFRMKFIDTKLPGHRRDLLKERTAASAVGVVQDAYKKARGFKTQGGLRVVSKE